MTGGYANIYNNGTINAGLDGVLISGYESAVANTGFIGAGNIGVDLEGDYSSLSNTGTIAADFGVEMSSVLSSTLVNTGSILGQGIFACGVNVTQGLAKVYNDGIISGDLSGIEVLSLGARLLLVNHGSITSVTDAIYEADIADGMVVENFGTISGGYYSIAGGLSSDKIVNRGIIDGDVILGGGDDTFDGVDGTVVGSIDGESGNDLYIVSDADLVILEAVAGADVDEVRATVDYALSSSAYIEILTLIGNARIGTGNSLGNLINGNIQNNVLNGLAGTDNMTGGTGDDKIFGGLDSDYLYGGDGARHGRWRRHRRYRQWR